jgi:hypothetical protein
VKRDPSVQAWLDGQPAQLRAIARSCFERMRACGADVVELMHDGCPTVCVEDGGFAYVNTFTAHVNVGFLRGSALKDPAGLLKGTGKLGRHVKLRPGTPADEQALAALIKDAYRDIKERLRAEAARSAWGPAEN